MCHAWPDLSRTGAGAWVAVAATSGAPSDLCWAAWTPATAVRVAASPCAGSPGCWPGSVEAATGTLSAPELY